MLLRDCLDYLVNVDKSRLDGRSVNDFLVNQSTLECVFLLMKEGWPSFSMNFSSVDEVNCLLLIVMNKSFRLSPQMMSSSVMFFDKSVRSPEDDVLVKIFAMLSWFMNDSLHEMFAWSMNSFPD